MSSSPKMPSLTGDTTTTSGSSSSSSSPTNSTTTKATIPPPTKTSHHHHVPQPLQASASLSKGNKAKPRKSKVVASASSLVVSFLRSCCTMKLFVLLVLCFQNSMFTILRRYSQGVLKEMYSKYEVLLAGEAIKMIVSALMIQKWLRSNNINNNKDTDSLPLLLTDSSKNSSGGSGSSGEGGGGSTTTLPRRLWYLVMQSHKMMVLALIYGAMNILSFISLRNIGAGMFTIFAQCKILTTATFSTLILQRRYSATKWRALIGLMFGVLLFSEPIWRSSLTATTTSATGTDDSNKSNPVDLLQQEQQQEPRRDIAVTNGNNPNNTANPLLGTLAVLIEVTLSGFASIYFEKVIKTDPLKLTIWERNFQLAMTSFPVYLTFILFDDGGPSGHIGGGWSWLTCAVAAFGAAGGLLVALSIKYGDAILKTLATTGAIVLSSLLDHAILGGPLTPTMMIAGIQVILSIFNYTFDKTPPPTTVTTTTPPKRMATMTTTSVNGTTLTMVNVKDHKSRGGSNGENDEEVGLLKQRTTGGGGGGSSS